jgi:hypothetical protein
MFIRLTTMLLKDGLVCNMDIITQAVNVLNEALESDPIAMNQLINLRVMCNENLARHPSIQVGKDNRYQHVWWVGLFGIINGIFGVDDEGWGFIEAEINDADGMVVRFHDRRTKQVNL